MAFAHYEYTTTCMLAISLDPDYNMSNRLSLLLYGFENSGLPLLDISVDTFYHEVYHEIYV